jgi:hypothetical protein
MLEKLADFIGRLQQKPEHIKTKIMWTGVSVCMLFVLSVWFWSLNESIFAKKNEESDNKKIIEGINQVKKDVPTLWGSLGAGIGNVVDSIKEETSITATPSGSSDNSVAPGEKLPIE